MKASEEQIEEALLLLREAHRRLLDTHNYGIDLLVYRATQLLGGVSALSQQDQMKPSVEQRTLLISLHDKPSLLPDKS